MFIGQSRAFGGPGETPYSAPFLGAFLAASTSPISNLGEAAKSLFKRSDYRQAHPTPEHLMPIVVAAGAVEGGNEGGEGKVGEVVFEEDDGPIGWAMIRWD